MGRENPIKRHCVILFRMYFVQYVEWNGEILSNGIVLFYDSFTTVDVFRTFSIVFQLNIIKRLNNGIYVRRLTNRCRLIHVVLNRERTNCMPENRVTLYWDSKPQRRRSFLNNGKKHPFFLVFYERETYSENRHWENYRKFIIVDLY